MISLVTKAVHNPQQIPSKGKKRLKTNWPIIGSLTKQGRLLEAALYAPQVVDIDLYSPYLSRREDSDGHVLTPVLGGELYINPSDTGISHEIYATGSHEEETVKCFGRALNELRQQVEGPVTVLEIGANLGFYLLVESEVLGDDTKIYAVEPAPQNAALLRKNIHHNGLDSVVDIEIGAIGEKCAENTLNISEHSNKHSIANTDHNHTGETLTTQTWDFPSFLDMKGIDAESVNVVRLDVEGYELEIFRGGLASFFESTDTPLIVGIEVHNNVLSEAEREEVFSTLEQEFDLIRGFQHSSKSECLAEITNWDDARELGWVELILSKNMS